MRCRPQLCLSGAFAFLVFQSAFAWGIAFAHHFHSCGRAAPAGCQTAQVNAPSGKPETTVTAPSDKVRPLVLNDLLNNGFTIKSDTPYQMVVEQPSKNFWANALLGSNWNPQVNVRVSLTFVPVGNSTRIVADMVAVTNPGSGFEQLTPLSGTADMKAMQDWLDGLGLEVMARRKAGSM